MSHTASYVPDDEPDAPGAGAAGARGRAWLVGGGAALGGVAVVAGALGVLAWLRAEDRRAARVEAIHAEVEATRAAAMPVDARTGRRVPPGPPSDADFIPLETVTDFYHSDAAAADARYKGTRFRTAFRVRDAGAGWVGTYRPLGPPRRTDVGRWAVPDGAVPNVLFELRGVDLAADTPVVVEAVCAGLDRETVAGPRLTFTAARLVPR